MALPNLDEFLEWSFPNNSYIDDDRFGTLYVRKGQMYVSFKDGTKGWCRPTLTIARIEASNPGNGNFQTLIDGLIEKNYAVYIECVLEKRFAKHLLKMGFVQVNAHSDNHFIINHNDKIFEEIQSPFV